MKFRTTLSLIGLTLGLSVAGTSFAQQGTLDKIKASGTITLGHAHSADGQRHHRPRMRLDDQ